MANIEDYIGWRGDVSFDYDPFNEVDNLIMASLAYVDFENVLDDREAPVPVGELDARYFAIHTPEELYAREFFTKTMPFLLTKMAASRRFSGIRAFGYENHIDPKKECQMSVVTLLLDERTAYVSFRGTDDTVVGWKEDFELSYRQRTTGQQLAVDYMNRRFKDTDLTLYVGGHSKGGNFAVYASAFCCPEVKKRIKAIYSNDSPGFISEVAEDPEYQEILGRVVSIVPEETIIGTLLTTTKARHIVKSSAKGILQHDALSWQVYGNHFEEVPKRSDVSLLLESMMGNWLGKLDEKERQVFVEALFGFFENTQKGTFEEIKKNGASSLSRIMQAAITMPKEERETFVRALWELIKSGSDTAVERVKEQFSGMIAMP